MIQLFKPYVPEETVDAIKSVLDSGCLTQGKKVDEFESKFSTIFNRKHCVSVNSGTSALETAYDLSGLKAGDEVLVTPLTCSATNIPLLARGCKLVWCDIDRDTLCIDPEDVDRKVTERTKAIVQVHLGGVQAEVREDLYDIPVISDACQALGIFTGDYTACSFQAIKHVTTADGGMLVVNSESDYDKAKLIRWFGIDRTRKIPDSWESYRTRMMSFDIDTIGGKRHMNDLNAAIGLIGLNSYSRNLAHRRACFNVYKQELARMPGVKIVDGVNNVYWLMTLLVNRRDDFAKKLYDAGIETNLVQVRNDRYKIFEQFKSDSLPVMDELESKYISIPIGPHLKEGDVRFICRTIKSGW
jgi:perosamine synthetase